MLKYKGFTILMFILYFIGTIADVSAQVTQRSYRRDFPASVSPKPEMIQERESRQEMETEVKKEENQQQSLLGAEQIEFLETRQKEKEAEEMRKEADRLYKEGEYEEAAKLYKEADKLAREKPVITSAEPTAEERPKPGAEPPKVYYQISIGDKLFISVWRVPDLSLEFTVGPDGYISFPLIGDIYAYGKTLSELDAEITEKLKEYVIRPEISVMIREFAGDKVTILGEVRSSGIYRFIRRTNIIDIIAEAGGFTDRAKVVSVVILREPDYPQKDPELIVVNAKNILKGKLRNMEVKPNDIVYVSRTFVSNLQEFYKDWVGPMLGTVADTAIDYETFMALRRARRH